MTRKKLATHELGRKNLDEYRQADKLPLVIILDNVRSLNNIGSVFRTADAFLVEAIFLCGISGTPPHREIQKTALGATDSVSWKYYPSTAGAVKFLQSNGYEVLAIEQTSGSRPLQEVQLSGESRYALVFGNEVHGVDQEVINLADQCIEIPQFGTKHSFNIAVSAGIVLWELHRQLVQKKEPR